MNVFCPKCDTECRDDMDVCPACGVKLDAPSDEVTALADAVVRAASKQDTTKQAGRKKATETIRATGHGTHTITGVCTKCHHELVIEVPDQRDPEHRLLATCDHCGQTSSVQACLREKARQKKAVERSRMQAEAETRRVERKKREAEEKRQRDEALAQTAQEAETIRHAIREAQAKRLAEEERTKLAPRPCPVCENPCCPQACVCPKCGHPFQRQHSPFNAAGSCVLLGIGVIVTIGGLVCFGVATSEYSWSRFQTDNAYGATANALESMKLQLDALIGMAWLCAGLLLCACGAVGIVNGAVKRLNSER